MITQGTRLNDYSSAELGMVVSKELGSNTVDIVAAVALWGLYGVAAVIGSGLAGIALGFGSTGYGLQGIIDNIDSKNIADTANSCFSEMVNREKSGLLPGYARVTYEHQRWVSANGEQWGGICWVPVKIRWVSSKTYNGL